MTKINSLNMLNEIGDITLSWDEKDNEKMINIIDNMLKQGYRFYIIKEGFIPLFNKKVVLENIDQAKSKKKVFLADEHLEKLVAEGVVGLNKNTSNVIEFTTIAKTAAQVVSNNTAAIKPMRGG